MTSDLKFLYFAPGDIQIARVDRQCIVYFCEALSLLGVDVELVAMGIELHAAEITAVHPLDLYRIKNRFPVNIVQTQVHQQSGGYRWAWRRLLMHTAQAMKYSSSRGQCKSVVFYTKNYGSAFAFMSVRRVMQTRSRIVFEIHRPPLNAFQRHVLKKTDAVVANSQALAEALCKSQPLLSRKTIATHQGVNLDPYNETRMTKVEARQKLGLSTEKKLAVYTGKIFWRYREIDYLIKTAQLLSEEIELVLVGGRADHVARFQELIANEGIANVKFVGFVAPIVVHYYQFAADVLLLYYPSGIDLNDYRSPGKLFEYMAAGRPIIAADYPVLREVLGADPAAVLVPPDAPTLLARAIAELLGDPARMESLATRALELAKQFTWEIRAKKILNFVESLAPRNERC